MGREDRARAEVLYRRLSAIFPRDAGLLSNVVKFPARDAVALRDELDQAFEELHSQSFVSPAGVDDLVGATWIERLLRRLFEEIAADD